MYKTRFHLIPIRVKRSSEEEESYNKNIIKSGKIRRVFLTVSASFTRLQSVFQLVFDTYIQPFHITHIMARSLRPDIPSRRASPGVGRSGPPPLGTLDQAPLGTFQANRALNGDQGAAARQRARLRHSASTAPTRVPSPHEWDPDAFPMDHDLFGEDFRGYSGMDTIQRHPVGGELPFAGSTRLGQNFGLEGGGTVILRGLGPVPPRSPVSDEPSSLSLSCVLTLNRTRSKASHWCASLPLSPKSQPIPTILSRSCRFSNHQSAVMVAFDSILLILLSTASMVLAAPAPPTPPSTQSTQPTQPIKFDLSLRRVVANSKKTIFLEPDKLRPNEACSFQFMPATASDTNKHPITFEPEKEAFGTRWTLKRNTLKRLHPDNIKLGTLSFATAELQEQILGSTGTQQGQLADRGIEGPNLLEALSNWMETADGFRFTPEPSGIQDYTMLQELRIAKENPQRYENWDVEGKSFNVNTLLLSTMVID
ncbi:hypothetical protein C8R42DRAFT_779243 [Lentinula raphanica]|nr:hypothetical protein C8R42DRAFT_779243 [Lentinula raphanica]